MNTEIFTNLISHPEILKDFQVAELKNITKKISLFSVCKSSLSQRVKKQ